MPSAFAVFRLITNSYLVGCCTGVSPGFPPLRILSTKPAALRKVLGESAAFEGDKVETPMLFERG